MITLRAGLLALALVAGAVPAGADEAYPARPVTIVVPFPPGGLADVTARPLAAALERGLKQPVVVTNKAGAAGAVGMQSVAVAKPDGYTLLPTLKELGYDVEYYLWAGLFAPRGIPPTVLKTLRDGTRQAVQDPEFKSAMEKVQTPIVYQDADEFKTWWDRDAAVLADVVKRIGRVDSK